MATAASVEVHAATEYTFCIDGGGSKTLLQIIDSIGNIVPILRKGAEALAIEAGPSNINSVKKEGVRTALRDLFEGLQVGQDPRDLKDIMKSSRVVAGMAGVSLAQNHEAVVSLFEEIGWDKEKLLLLTDVELAVRLIKGNGVVLISGTGSICYAVKDGVRQRVGGLGRILGDEGSGYQIGLQAIRAGLAEEFGYGKPTSLTAALRTLFQVDELKTLFPKINSLEMSSAEISSAAPLVFEKAHENDPVAAEIISRASEDLRQMVETALKVSQLSDCELHLWGGTFKGQLANPIIERLSKELSRITVVNKSNENGTVSYAKTLQEK